MLCFGFCAILFLVIKRRGFVKMEVIRPGRTQKGPSKKFKCTGAGNSEGGCGAILRVSEYDLYITTNSCMGEEEDYKTFCCTQCGTETDVKEYSLTPRGKKPSERERRKIAEKNTPPQKPAWEINA